MQEQNKKTTNIVLKIIKIILKILLIPVRIILRVIFRTSIDAWFN